MKSLLYILPLLLVACEQSATIVDPPARSGWESVQSQGATGLDAVQFVGTRHGWIAAADGIVLQTTDGGTTWNRRQTGITGDITDLHFRDTLDGWAVGLGKQIVHTTDGGTTWSQVFDAPELGGSLQAIRFSDAANGWAVGSFPLVRTTDGGRSWHYEGSEAGYDLFAIEFADSEHGWTAGRRTIYHADSLHHDFAGVILRTLDGGDTWDTTNLPTSINGLYFLDTETGWAVGAGGAIYKTSDGGASWSQQPTQSTLFLRDVHFVDRNNGWATGGALNNGMLRTTDGGATWREQFISTYGEINSLWFHDSNNGWAVGQEGNLLRTTRGGESW